jgi:hypothetical protein
LLARGEGIKGGAAKPLTTGEPATGGVNSCGLGLAELGADRDAAAVRGLFPCHDSRIQVYSYPSIRYTRIKHDRETEAGKRVRYRELEREDKQR